MFNKMIAGVLPYFPKDFIWLFSKRYVAGKNLDEGINASKKLNDQGIVVTIDLLGEFIKNLSEAEDNKNQYLNIVKAFQKQKIQGSFSIKPTFFGLLINEEAAYNNIREVVALAAKYDNFVRIDMEDSPCTDREITLYRRLKQEFPNHVGLVLQAYLKRTLDDVKGLMDTHHPEAPLNFRLCKGIYVEPHNIAFKGFQEIRDHFLKDLEFMLQNDIYVGIATHDDYLVNESIRLINKYQVPNDKFEFQMLYGVTPNLRQYIVNKGYKMRVYVPFGKDWFGYCTRRLKENPKMATDIIKALFVRG